MCFKKVKNWSKRNKIILSIFIVLVLIFVSFSIVTFFRPNREQDLKLMLISDKSNYSLNQSIVITIQLTNRESLPVGFSDSFSNGEHIHLSLTDPSGYKSDTHLKPVGDFGNYPLRILFSGQSLSLSFDLTEIEFPKGSDNISFNQIGKYKLSAMIVFPIYSNEVVFNIV